MKSFKNIAFLAVALLLSFNTIAQTTKDVVDVAAGSKEHTTLVKAIKAADLVNTLKGQGPFTIFAPTNNAFTKLPAGTLDNLLKAENKSTLAGVLTYHVVAGNLDAKSILAAIEKDGGKAVLTTLAGGNITATILNGKVTLTDEKGGEATVLTTDLVATNGVIHVIDKVLLP